MASNPVLWDFIKERMKEHIGDPCLLISATDYFKKYIPKKVVGWVDDILNTKSLSYRDALIIQLAYGITAKKSINLTLRHPGARGLGKKVGKFLAANHISHVADAYQNIGKNTTNLVRDNYPNFDNFLYWISDGERSKDELNFIFEYACARIAETSRPVLPFPEIDTTKLTFSAVFALMIDLLSVGSQGANEQFMVAAFLDALLVQVGVTGYRVETKNLNASDKSSRTAGDVQILIGNRVVEAYEVTANIWEEKIGGAEATIKANDLSRLHIIASAPQEQYDQVLRALNNVRDDISIIDIKSFTSMLISALTRQHRLIALERLYEFLDRYQPDVGKVNRYVSLIDDHKLILI